MSGKVVILAGGKGERLRPFTEDRPKPMIEVLGSPLLAYQLNWVRAAGFQHIIMACGYRHEVIESYFGDGSKWQVKIDYLVETQPLGRGGAIKRALQSVDTLDGPILVLNGDMVTSLHIDGLLNFHKQHSSVATLVTVPLRSPYGIVELADDGCVRRFSEKPILPFWINAGIYVFSPEIIELLPDKGDHEQLTFPGLAQNDELRAFKSSAFWRTVDTVKDVSELRAELEKLLFERDGGRAETRTTHREAAACSSPSAQLLDQLSALAF